MEPIAIAWFDLRSACVEPPPLEWPGATKYAIGKAHTPLTTAECLTPANLRGPALKLRKLLVSKATGPGRHYVLKALTPWLLPQTVTLAILLDHDLIFAVPPNLLAAEFDHFTPTTIWAAVEDLTGPAIYKQAPLMANGGLQLMNLTRMRAGPYEAALGAWNTKIGYLGDQTMMTVLSRAHPEWFFKMSCKWNRQFNGHLRLKPSVFSCKDGCNIMHANFMPLKPQFRKGLKTGDWSEMVGKLSRNVAIGNADCIAKLNVSRTLSRMNRRVLPS